MKKIILLIAFVVVAVSINAQNSSQINNISSISSTGGIEYNSSTKTYVATKATRNKVEPIKTEYKYQDCKGNTHDVYISKNGRCFYYVTNKEGEQDKRYLPKEVSREIAAKVGIEYKETDGK